MAALLVGVLWGCSKNLDATDPSVLTTASDIPAIRKISVEDVKKWYKEPPLGTLGTRSEGTKTGLGAVPLFPTALQTTGSYINSLFNGTIEYVIAPIKKNEAIPMDRSHGSFLFFFRDADGTIKNRLAVFNANSEAYKDALKVVNLRTFTGQVIFLDENNKITCYQELVEGLVTIKKESFISLKTVAESFRSDGGSVLSTRCDDSRPDCYNGWGKSGWQKFWGGVKKVFSTYVFNGMPGSVTLGGTFDRSQQTTPDNGFSWVPTEGGGGGGTIDAKTTWCSNLESGWEDDKAQAVFDGEVPRNYYTGYISTSSVADLAFRSKLRDMKLRGLDCSIVHQLNEMPKLVDKLHQHLNNKNYNTTSVYDASQIVQHVIDNPYSKPLVEQYGDKYCENYAPTGFTPMEFIKLAADAELFAQVDKVPSAELKDIVSKKGIKFLPYYVWEKDKIDYTSLKPCLSMLFADLNRTIFTSGIGEMGNIVKQFADGFNADTPAPAYNVAFNVVENLPLVNADPKILGYTVRESDGIRIFFKKDFISKASDAAIVLVYLHEMLHAFMIYQTEIRKISNAERVHACLFEDGKPTPQEEAQHSQMANNYVEILNEAITKWAKSKNMSQTEIDKLKDIAWNGLYKTVEYAKKKNDDSTFISRIEKQMNEELNNSSSSTGKKTTASCY